MIQDSGLRRFYENYGDTLLRILASNIMVIPPHVLAEVSNIVRKEFQLSVTLDKGNPMANLIRSTHCDERTIPLTGLLGHTAISGSIDLGITDCVLMALSSDADCLLSEDKDLIAVAKQMGLEAMTPLSLVFG